jgi:hypothetical protein
MLKAIRQGSESEPGDAPAFVYSAARKARRAFRFLLKPSRIHILFVVHNYAGLHNFDDCLRGFLRSGHKVTIALPEPKPGRYRSVPASLRGFESRLGDLSYGIYLNHSMVAGVLLWLANTIGGEPFGRYGTPGFVILILIACSLVALLTFNMVERPVEMLRRRIKNRSIPEAAPAATRPEANNTNLACWLHYDLSK